MLKKRIPFNRVFTTNRELNYIKDAIKRDNISSFGFYTKKCQRFLEKKLHLKKVLLTSSCTHALEISALALNLKPKDEIILPSFTFPSTANPFLLRGAKLIFVDIRPDTLNINEELIENSITKRTKAIIAVHYGGVGCEMATIMKTAKKNKLIVIEDAASSLFGKYRGKYLGSFGTFGAISFHQTKSITCGEGGALFINDSNYFDKSDIIHEKGTNKKAFLEGKIKSYSWQDIGSSYGLSEINAAFLWAQLKKVSYIQKRKKKLWKLYYDSLKEWAIDMGIKFQTIPEYCQSAYSDFPLIMPSEEVRIKFIEHMKKNGIICHTHYKPLHNSKAALKFGISKTTLPVTDWVSKCIVRLPMHASLKDALVITQVAKNFKFLVS